MDLHEISTKFDITEKLAQISDQEVKAGLQEKVSGREHLEGLRCEIEELEHLEGKQRGGRVRLIETLTGVLSIKQDEKNWSKWGRKRLSKTFSK